MLPSDPAETDVVILLSRATGVVLPSDPAGVDVVVVLLSDGRGVGVLSSDPELSVSTDDVFVARKKIKFDIEYVSIGIISLYENECHNVIGERGKLPFQRNR